MSLQGLPDFHQPIQVGGLQIFYPYEGGRDHILVPDQLEVTERNDGRPDFLLELVRGQNPLLSPAPYGVLDFRVRPRYPMEETLKLLRDRHPMAMLAPAVFSSGFLRLRPVADDVPADLRIPVPLAWNGLGITRCILKLSPPAITLLKRLLLEAEVLALHAAAEVEMIGVSPRLPIRIRFNPAELLETLSALGNEKRQIAREDLVNFFRTAPTSLPLEVHGKIEGLELDGFAEAVADRVRVRFGAFVPAPETDVKPHLSCCVKRCNWHRTTRRRGNTPSRK